MLTIEEVQAVFPVAQHMVSELEWSRGAGFIETLFAETDPDIWPELTFIEGL